MFDSSSHRSRKIGRPMGFDHCLAPGEGRVTAAGARPVYRDRFLGATHLARICQITRTLTLAVAVCGAPALAQTASPAPAPTPAAPLVPPPTPGAAALLLQQATFWRSQNDPVKAAYSLRRVLELQPNNPDALALVAQIDAEQGNTVEAQTYADRLRQVSPANPHLAEVQESLRLGPIDQAELTQARLLASQGRVQDGLKLYRVAFRGPKPPRSLAIEYYGLLAGTDLDGFETARKSMAALVAEDPNDAALQLAYARLLGNREFTREDGLDRLQALARVPAISAAARASWRQVILWEGPSIPAMRRLRLYMADNPNDPQIAAQYKDFTDSLPDDGEQARDKGFEEIRDHKMVEAEADFQAALKYNPKDWKAMMMLAAIRNTQKKVEDAHALIQQALAIKPDQRDFILKSSGGDFGRGGVGDGRPGGWKNNYSAADARLAATRASAAIRGQYREVARLTQQGRTDEAERLLQRLSRGRASAAYYVQLGDIQLQAGQTEPAELSFRQALRLRASDPDAAFGLGRTLTQQGKADSAAQYYSQAEAAYRAAGNAQALNAMNNGRAQLVRARADLLADPAARIPLYRQALAIDPTDPWIRLSLARDLSRQGQGAEARMAMAPLDHANDTASIEASIYFAQGMGETEKASALIDRLAPARRSADMLALQSQVAIRRELAQLPPLGDPADRRIRLLALARAPDPTGARGAAIGQALIAGDDKASVAAALAASLAATPRASVDQRLAYASTLAEAGEPEAAAMMLAPVAEGPLAPPQRAPLEQVKDSIAVAHADALNRAKRPADAYDYLAPRLAVHPDNPDLKLALSRLYATNGHPAEALQISQSVLSTHAGDVEVRIAAANAAVAAGDLPLANRIVGQGIGQFPAEPRLHVLSASIAQAQGRDFTALRELHLARTLRQKQLQGG